MLSMYGHSQESKWRYEMDSVMVFSSPRFTDLNKDGVKDVVVGAGAESVPTSHGIVAINGADGSLLWKIPTKTQVYISALFQDITGDGTDDVFIGGRAASYFAINGATGEIVWEFFSGTQAESRQAGYLNFFGTQFVEDYDDDGFLDLLVTNSGDYLAGPEEKNRPTGRLMILSAASGKILRDVRMPEPRESYYAPHVFKKGRKEMILFGTGGETVDGSLWQLPMKSFLKEKTSGAKRILQDTTKGFILNSLLADVNNDGVQDILSARMNATLTAVDGKNHKVLWEHTFDNRECYVTPALGQFTGDETPDFATIIAEGTFPQYRSFMWIIVDGSTGEISESKPAGMNQFSPAVSADVNGDGMGEIIYLENKITDPKTYAIENTLKVIDFANDTSWHIGPSRTGLSMASAPGIVDLDDDGTYEIVVVTSPMGGGNDNHGTIECIRLGKDINPAWPGYLGKNENGTWE